MNKIFPLMFGKVRSETYLITVPSQWPALYDKLEAAI